MRFFWNNSTEENAQIEQERADYSSYSKEELLDTFKSEAWEGLDEDSRIAVVQEMENRTAAEQGRPAAEVVSSSDSSAYGGYTSTSNRISINVSDFSSYEVLDTYVHESNHAYQSHCIETEEGYDYDDHTLTMMEAEMARDEQGNLYNYARTSPEYDMQCNELDSNNKAATFMLEQRERYENDPSYRSYIEERAAHFSEVNSSIDNNPDERARLQNDQAYIAYVRGDITEDQYNLLSSNINDTKYQDSAVAQSKSVGASIAELNNEFQNEVTQESTSNNNYLGAVDSFNSNVDANPYIGNIEGVTTSNSAEGYLGTASTAEVDSAGMEGADNSAENSSGIEQ